MTLLRCWVVVVAFAVFVAGCGGSDAGSVPTSKAVARKACSISPVRHTLQTCRSPDGPWVMSLRYDPSSSACNLFFGRGGTKRSVWKFHQGGNSCSQETWVTPHKLLFQSDVLVESVDPTTHKSKLIATLSGFSVSPNAKWIAGTGPGDPNVSSEAQTVYVLSVGAHKCLVVPGSSADPAGFTPDSKNVIVRRAYHSGHLELRQFALTALGSGCPTGANGVLPTRS